MKNGCLLEDAPARPPLLLLREGYKRRTPVLRSAIVTVVLLATATLLSTMVFVPKALMLFLPATALTSLISTAVAFPPHSHAAIKEVVSADHYGHGKLGAVASESAICSAIGRDLLLRGGNAADALVGTTFCVGTIGMYHSGIGGGGFMLVRGPDGEYENIDFRETAPATAHKDMYENNMNGSIFGGLASGVPGEVAGLGYLHEKYGKLPWKEVMQGAIRTARYGFPVTADLVRYMAAATSGEATSFLETDPNWAIDFAPNGTLVKLGDTITRKRLADTLETIAEMGADEFYHGQMAHQMIAAVEAANGTMTMSDLSNYSVALPPPVSLTYRDKYTLHSVSAPASGSIALSMLNILSGYDDIGSPTSLNLSTHRLDESMRFAYAQRTALGDPAFVPNISSYESSLLDPETGSHIRSRISDIRTFNISHYDPSGFEILDTPGTSHVVTADASGLAISLTTTVNLLFGSRVLVPETGVIMNNEMDDFSIPGRKNAFGFKPSPANYIAPGKRPLSSIACTIVEHAANNSLYFVTGAAGGSRITTATVQTLWAVLDRGMSAAEALAMPRMHDQLVPDQVTFEFGYENSTVAFMEGLGHEVRWVGTGWSSAQCLRRDGEGVFEAASEPRQMASGGYAV